MANGPATLGNVVTAPRVKKRQATTSKGTISKTRADAAKLNGTSGTGTGGGTHAPISLPQLDYGVGPFDLTILDYEFRLSATNTPGVSVPVEEIETISWDDSSALMTGSVTFREPEWAQKLGISQGNQIYCEYREQGGVWQGVWTMRVYSPGKDFSTLERTFDLANDLQRLMDSTDTFKFAKEKSGAKVKGWRVDECIKFILDKYGIVIAPGGLPVMAALVTNWTVTDQAPLDVIKSLLLRQKNVTGLRYAFRLDAQGRAMFSSYSRPKTLYQLGPLLLAATYSVTRNARFATEVDVRSDPVTTTGTDLSGAAKKTYAKVLATVSTKGGIKQWGYVHRNVYSPDAHTVKAATDEGSLFLVSVARGDREFQVTLPGMPFLRRLDAVRFTLPQQGLKQVVYVTDAQHTVSGGSYTTDAVWAVDDPYTDLKADDIANKLSDAAVTRSRKATGTAVTGSTKPSNPKSTVAPTTLGNVDTPPNGRTGGKK